MSQLADEIERLANAVTNASTGPDRVNEWGRLSALVRGNLPAILSALRDREVMREALADFDASYAKCPFSPSQRHQADNRKACPSCGATARESCGKFVGASTVFINTARQALQGGGE